MQFRDGAQVITADGDKVGKIKRVVIEPKTKEATHIVVKKGLLFGKDKVIPMSLISPVEEESIKLRADAGDLDDLPDFEESHYIAKETIGQIQSSQGISSIYWYPPVASRWATHHPYNGGNRQPTFVFVKEKSRNIPEGTVALKEGAEVISSDEQIIGSVARVITDSPRQVVTHLFVSQGLIWTEMKLVPINWISNVDKETVTLSVSSEFIENLPEYQRNVSMILRHSFR